MVHGGPYPRSHRTGNTGARGGHKNRRPKTETEKTETETEMTETEKTVRNLGSKLEKTEIKSKIRVSLIHNPNRPKDRFYFILSELRTEAAEFVCQPSLCVHLVYGPNY